MHIEEIYKEHGQLVYKYLLCLSHNESIAEELTQETFYIAIKKINSFQGKCKVSVWSCQIAKFLWYGYVKKLKQTINIDTIENIANEVSIEEIIIGNEEKEEMFKNMMKLDNNSKAVMYLRVRGELSFKEIGIILNKSENWAKNIFYRGKNKLKEEIVYEED